MDNKTESQETPKEFTVGRTKKIIYKPKPGQGETELTPEDKGAALEHATIIAESEMGLQRIRDEETEWLMAEAKRKEEEKEKAKETETTSGAEHPLPNNSEKTIKTTTPESED